MKTRAIQPRCFTGMPSISTRFGRAVASHVHSTRLCLTHLYGRMRQPNLHQRELSGRCALYFITAPDLFSASSGASPRSGSLASGYSRIGSASIPTVVPFRHVWLEFIGQPQLSRSKTSTNYSMTPTPNQALQPTGAAVTLAAILRSNPSRPSATLS